MKSPNSIAFVSSFFLFGIIGYLNAAVLYSDDFQSDTIGTNPAGWFASTGVPGYNVVADPVDAGNHAMSTSGGTSRTVSIMHSLPAMTSGGDITLTLDLYLGNAGDANWNSKWYLEAGTMSNSSFFTNGYGFQLNQGSVSLQITTGAGTSTNQGSATVLASSSVPSGTYNLSGWNEVTFLWKENGELSLSVNGDLLLTYTDTTYSPAFRTIKNTSFLNNTATVNGRTLYFDDIEVTTTAVPEPSAGLMLGLLGAAALCWKGRDIRRRLRWNL